MRNKLMKRLSAAAMSGVLAATMALGTGMPVLAEPEVPSTGMLGIDKVFQFSYGVSVPDFSFVFDVTPVSVNGQDYDPAKQNMPKIDQIVSKYVGGSIQNEGQGTGSVEGGIVSVTSEYLIDFNDVAWQHAGVYVYEVSENEDASAAYNASHTANGYQVSYSNAAYRVRIGVKEDGNGGFTVTDAVVETSPNKIVVDENGVPVANDGTTANDEETPDYMKTAPASVDPNAVTLDGNKPDPSTKAKVDGTPSNPYDPSKLVDKDGDGTPESPDVKAGDTVDADGDGNPVDANGNPVDGSGNPTDADRNENGDRGESSGKNGFTFTNTLLQTIGSDEAPDEGQDKDNDPTDDPQEIDPSNVDPDAGHDNGQEEAANHNFYVGKKVTGDYADKTQFFDFTLNLTVPALAQGSVLTYHAYIMTCDENEVWKLTPQGSADLGTPYTSTVTFNGETLDCYEISTGTPFSFKLKHNQRLIFTSIASGMSFTATEEAVPEYDSTIEVVAGGAVVDGTTGYAANGKNAIDVTNDNTTASPTGIVINNLPYILVALLVAAAFVVSVAVKGKKRVSR